MKMNKQIKKVPEKSNKKLFNINISSFFMRNIPYQWLSAYKSSIKNKAERDVLYIFKNYMPHIRFNTSICEFHKLMLSSSSPGSAKSVTSSE